MQENLPKAEQVAVDAGHRVFWLRLMPTRSNHALSPEVRVNPPSWVSERRCELLRFVACPFGRGLIPFFINAARANRRERQVGGT